MLYRWTTQPTSGIVCTEFKACSAWRLRLLDVCVCVCVCVVGGSLSSASGDGETVVEERRCRAARLCTAQSRWMLAVTWYNVTAPNSTDVCICIALNISQFTVG